MQMYCNFSFLLGVNILINRTCENHTFLLVTKLILSSDPKANGNPFGSFRINQSFGLDYTYVIPAALYRHYTTDAVD